VGTSRGTVNNRQKLVCLLYISVFSSAPYCILGRDRPVTQARTICELVDAEESLNGQMVRLKARVVKVEHGNFLGNDGCFPTILLITDSEVRPKRKFEVVKNRLWHEFDGALADIVPPSNELRNTVFIEVEGRFDHAYKKRGAVEVRTGDSFAPFPEWRRRLVLKEVIELRLEPRKLPAPQKLDPQVLPGLPAGKR
jgi:hypothetical protein